MLCVFVAPRVEQQQSQGLDYDDYSEEEEEEEEEEESGDGDEEDPRFKKYVAMSQTDLDNKLVEMQAKKMELQKTASMHYHKILKQAELELSKKIYEPSADAEFVERPDGTRIVRRSAEEKAKLKQKEELTKKNLRKVNEAMTKVLELQDESMVQVLFDCVEHELNKKVHYAADIAMVDDELHLIYRAIEEKDHLVAERRRQRRAAKFERKVQESSTGERSAAKKRKPARAESVYSVSALVSNSTKRRKSK